MEIRAANLDDLGRLIEIDGTIESSRYLHVERTGEGLSAAWRLEERPLRVKRVDTNTPNDEARFALRQVLSGIEEGIALAVELEGDLAALCVAQIDGSEGLLRLLDVRVDYDLRRQGIGTGLVFQLIGDARERGLRAVSARVETNNLPANQFLAKAGFELGGLDTHYRSNHDLVKESATLFWYAVLD